MFSKTYKITILSIGKLILIIIEKIYTIIKII